MKTVECPFCNAYLQDEKGLKRHITDQHPGKDNYFNFYGYKVYEKKGTYLCPICNEKIYKTPGSLRSHMNEKHKKEIGK